MAVNFPNSPTVGQKFNAAGRTYQYNNSLWEVLPYQTALSKNRVINPAMQVSQQNGDTDSPYAASSVWFPADQWECMFAVPGSSMTMGRRPAGGLSPGSYSIFLYSSAAVASFGTGTDSHAQLRQWLEGNRMADFLWGTPQAKPIVMRFWALNSFPGTFCCKCTNGATNRSYCAPFTITAGDTWQQFTVPIPGDTTGTWATDTAPGMLFGAIPGIDTAYRASAANTWVAGDAYGFPGMSPSFCTSGPAAFHICNWEIYLDPYGTGVAPTWVQPQYASDLRDSQRYWWKAECLRGVSGSVSVNRATIATPMPLRIPPSVSMVGTVPVHEGATGGSVTGIAGTYQSVDNVELELNTTGGLTAGRAGITYRDGTNYFAVNARF
jgi:hypothetical protein